MKDAQGANSGVGFGWRTAREIAKSEGVSVSTARKRLEADVAAGRAERRYGYRTRVSKSTRVVEYRRAASGR